MIATTVKNAANRRIGRYAERVRIYAILRILLIFVGQKSFKLKLLAVYMVKP